MYIKQQAPQANDPEDIRKERREMMRQRVTKMEPNERMGGRSSYLQSKTKDGFTQLNINEEAAGIRNVG